MAEGNNQFQLVIDNDLCLANIFQSKKQARTQKDKTNNLQISDRLHTRKGLALPHDPLALATSLIDFQERQKLIQNSLIRYILGAWINLCDQNGILKGKATRLFSFICENGKIVSNLKQSYDKEWGGADDSLSLANRMEKNMQKAMPNLKKEIKTYFQRVYMIFAHIRSKNSHD